MPVELSEDLKNVQQAQEIREQLGVSGELNQARRRPDEDHMRIVAVKPGKAYHIAVDLASRTAEMEERTTGVVIARMLLHINPGPHRVRGATWIFTRIWGWMSDTVVYLFLFVSISGIYMWAVIKSERKVGLILLGIGCVSIVLISYGLLA